jgi:tRNA 2-selenouridine synthase
MVHRIEADEFLKLTSNNPVIDVRSPGEFRAGHIPSSVNIPLFNNKERKKIGTLYHHKGREAAIVCGLDISLNKLERYQFQINRKVKGNKVLIYCWRGGMRSDNFAAVLNASGFDVFVLSGGYKAYRRFIRDELSKPLDVFILGGLTGSGKTRILQSLQRKGEQIIDLEKLAKHKGSVFGGLDKKKQPTNEQFENDLFLFWSKLDPSRRVWIEDESRMIGNITLPPPVFNHILNGLLVRINIPGEVRINHLVREYAVFTVQVLSRSIEKIRERLGGTRTGYAHAALVQGDYAQVARIVLEYYDKAYLHSAAYRKRIFPAVIGLDGLDPSRNADEILASLQNSLQKEDDLS